MAKKLMFILLVLIMMAAGSVVAMADEESAPLMNMIAETNENMQNIVMFDEAVQGST